jgi:hypothetical protein
MNKESLIEKDENVADKAEIIFFVSLSWTSERYGAEDMKAKSVYKCELGDHSENLAILICSYDEEGEGPGTGGRKATPLVRRLPAPFIQAVERRILGDRIMGGRAKLRLIEGEIRTFTAELRMERTEGQSVEDYISEREEEIREELERLLAEF